MLCTSNAGVFCKFLQDFETKMTKWGKICKIWKIFKICKLLHYLPKIILHPRLVKRHFQILKFFLNFLLFSFLFRFFVQTIMKKHILTSIWSVQHPISGQNIQQMSQMIFAFACLKYLRKFYYNWSHKNKITTRANIIWGILISRVFFKNWLFLQCYDEFMKWWNTFTY